MAHPYAAHKQHKVEHSRVAHITKGYASGGAVHSDEKADKKLIRKSVKKSALKMDGEHAKHRADKRARGGKVKHKGATINILNAPGHAAGGPMAGAPPMAPPMPPRPPMMPPPQAGMAPPPGAMPPGMPPGMPIRAKGGSIHRASGGRVKDGPAWKGGLEAGTQVQHSDGKSDGKNINRGRVVTFSTGGKVGQTSGTAGAATTYKASVRRVKPQQHEINGVPLRARGGPIESNDTVATATKLPGGAGGGEARLAKQNRARKDYAKTH